MSEERASRLDGWKSIASHLKRCSRTVQRWHAQYGLPVHHMGASTSGVFAYADEVDEWFRHDNRRLEGAGSRSAGDFPIEIPAKMPLWEADSTSGGGQHPADKARAKRLIDEGFGAWRLLSRSNLPKIARKFHEAIDLDPRNAEAYAGLSHALIVLGLMGACSLEAAYVSARAAAEMAFGLDPGSSESNCSLAWLKMTADRDWEGAQAAFDVLLEGGNGTARALAGRALLYIAQGNLGPASDMLYESWKRNPLSVPPLALHIWSEYLAGKFAEAMEHVVQARESGRFGPILAAVEALTATQIEKPPESLARIESLLKEDPTNDLVYGTLGYIAGTSGDKDKARTFLEHLVRRSSHARETEHYAIALIQIGLGEKAQAIQSVLRSYEKGSLWSLALPLDPLLQPLAHEEAFKKFVRGAYPFSAGYHASAHELVGGGLI